MKSFLKSSPCYHASVQIYTNYYANPLNCTSPSYTDHGDFSYNANNWITFNAQPSGGMVSQSFPLQINVTSTQSDIIGNGAPTGAPIYIYGCFGIDVDPSNPWPGNLYNIGTNYTANLLVNQEPLGTGIQNLFNNKQIKIYPNPFNNQVTLENTSQTAITKISICDMLGREVLSSNPNQTSTITVNTQSFDKGVYFIKIYNNSDSFTVKLIKE